MVTCAKLEPPASRKTKMRPREFMHCRKWKRVCFLVTTWFGHFFTGHLGLKAGLGLSRKSPCTKGLAQTLDQGERMFWCQSATPQSRVSCQERQEGIIHD